MAKMLSDNARAWQWSAVAGEQVVTRMRDSSYHKGIQWDADHIVPVIEGGGECGLSNLRTLCRDCHKRVTAELAKRRALARRRDKESA
jgi:5-methylcytosine-specific restriction endonuclease McrA